MAHHTSTAATTNTLLRQRLLHDIKELQNKPYPGVALHIQDDDMTKACLIVRPENERPLHMTLHFTDSYPLDPPDISMDSEGVLHPNVFGNMICVDILKRGNGYTPAYTLKGICIQMLSFFASDKIDQDYSGGIDREQFVKEMEEGQHHLEQLGVPMPPLVGKFACKKCEFGCATLSYNRPCDAPTSGARSSKLPTLPVSDEDVEMTDDSKMTEGVEKKREKLKLVNLSEDILLVFCDYLEDEDLVRAARAWNGFSRLIHGHNIIRTRELQCFTLKRGFNDLDLGIGVSASDRPRSITSEFDLISRDAFELYGVRRSIQGLSFQHWLPLPISEKHWERVRRVVDERINGIARASGSRGMFGDIIYNFMNEIVIQLSGQAAEVEARQTHHDSRIPSYIRDMHVELPKSTLTHASEKAIESYFQLFHLLLCLATERPDIAKHANDMLTKVVDGQQDKQHVPNLGHLLIMTLISDVEISEEVTQALIKEAITRNVVWMMEPSPKGKGMAELSFMETSPVSHYRLEKTFEAGKTSYRLFMFLNLMRKIVNHARTYTDQEGKSQKMTLLEFRTVLFKRHGAPPNGAAASMARAIRDIQKVSNFLEFLVNMGLPPSTDAGLTAFLRDCVEDSMNKGYSKWALTQEVALGLRKVNEPDVDVPAGLCPRIGGSKHFSFFPDERRRDGAGRGGGGRRGRGGRGDWGGRGGGRGSWHGGRPGPSRGRAPY